MKSLPQLSQIQRLLVVKTSSLGDVIHALPAVQVLKEAKPEVSIDWVVRDACADLLRGCPLIDRLYVLNQRPTIGDLLHLRVCLRKRRYDCALDMQGLALSGLITRISGAPVRLGWDRGREGNALFLTHPIVPGRPKMVGIRHEVDLLKGFAKALGVNNINEEFPAQHYLAETDSVPLPEVRRPIVAMNTGSARDYKRWPQVRWTSLAAMINVAGYGMVFVGAESDARVADEIIKTLPVHAPCVNLTGQTTLRELASVLAHCDLVVSGDTGPMHLAVAVGTPVVALFGATDPRRHGPYGSRNRILHDPARISEKRPTPEEGKAAMQAITAESVFAEVQSLDTAIHA